MGFPRQEWSGRPFPSPGDLQDTGIEPGSPALVGRFFTTKGAAEGEMVGWHHPLNGCESEQTPGDGEGQGSLAFFCPWGHKETDTT